MSEVLLVPVSRADMRLYKKAARLSRLTLEAWARQALVMATGRRACRVCSCTDADCRQCIARTGQPCHWVEDDLCSACVATPAKLNTVE